MRAAWLLALASVGCLGDIDPAWQLDHDRIVAVRATPPHIQAGSASVLDALIAHKGALTDVEKPTGALVLPTMPVSLQSAVVFDGSDWTVVAPSEDVLAAARTELMLDVGAPIPLSIGVAFGSGAGVVGSGSGSGITGEVATKIVYLGDAVDNPTITNVLVAGAPAPAAGSAISIATDTDVTFTTDADTTDTINWLTSCGTLHDDNEITSFIHVLPADPMSGELAVVRRTALGGVAFERWPISTPAAP